MQEAEGGMNKVPPWKLGLPPPQQPTSTTTTITTTTTSHLHQSTTTNQLCLFFCFAGVIAVVIFVSVSALAVTARFLYRRKGSCQSPEVKTVKPEDSPELAFSSQTSSQNGPTESQREYFI
uniref:Uncharacterized protein n=1 Tax=Stegastes partitus TaxID=144197 RepID=A0A3B4ZT99_9TELE